MLTAGYVATQAAVPVQVYDAAQPAISGILKTTANVYPGWMGANGTSATSIGNFFNVNDFALNSRNWQLDEQLKPDGETGLYPPYHYSGDRDAPPVAEGFSSMQGGDTHWLLLATDSAINDQYEIMAFAAEAQCFALGTTATSAQGIISADLTAPAIWKTDTYKNSFKDHVWHSAEFEFSYADQQNYWHALLNQFQLLPSQ